jgi:predicted DNA-binding transcriptional regulator AlpA
MNAQITPIKPDAAAGSLKSAAENFPRFGDKRAVAEMTGFSERTVSNFLAQGCPHLAVGKRRVRFDLDEVRAWLKEKYGSRRIGPVNGGQQ